MREGGREAGRQGGREGGSEGQRSWRQFFSAYMLPIRDLCATTFCVLLSFVFFTTTNNNVSFRHRRHVYAARLMNLRNRSIALRERWCHRSMAD